MEICFLDLDSPQKLLGNRNLHGMCGGKLLGNAHVWDLLRRKPSESGSYFGAHN